MINWGLVLQVKSLKNEFPHAADTLSFGISTGDSAVSVIVDVTKTTYTQVQVILTQGVVNQTQTQEVTKEFTNTYQFGSLANYSPVTVVVNGMTTSGIWEVAGAYSGDEYFPSVWVTPQVTNGAYYIPPGTKSTNLGNSQAVAEFDEQYYSPSDLSTFSSLMGVPNPNVTVHGTNNPDKPGGESTLDIEWITAIGIDVPTVFWYVEKGFLLAWTLEVSEDLNPPLVHSISYGEPEKLVRTSIANRVNQEFQLLGARGVSIISTSGDLGTSDGTPVCEKDVPDFPSSSPWTTSLGATFLTRVTDTSICTGKSVDSIPIYCDATAELPCAVDAGTGFTTGGGFSAIYPR